MDANDSANKNSERNDEQRNPSHFGEHPKSQTVITKNVNVKSCCY